MVLEESRKRASDDQGEEVERKRFHRGNEPLLKILVPNVTAGVLIGKGGSFLNEMKSQYGGYIRLSGNREYYPGTEERVVVLTGTVSQIIEINNCIMEKTQNTGRELLRDGRGDSVKIVVTNPSAGMLIGKGGATVKAIQEECHVKISIADTKVATVEGERILTMTGGSLEERSEACKQVIEKIAEEPGNMQNTRTKYTDIGMARDNGQNGSYQLPIGNVPRLPPRGNDLSRDDRQRQREDYSLSGRMTGLLGNMSSTAEKRELGNQLYSVLSGIQQGENRIGRGSAPKRRTIDLKSKAEVQLDVPSMMVGLLMGKEGKTVKDFVRRSGGAKFRFSEKDEVVEGTTDRTLTITGNMEQVQSAYNLVLTKAEEFQSYSDY